MVAWNMSVCQSEERSVKAGKTESTGICVSPQSDIPSLLESYTKGGYTGMQSPGGRVGHLSFPVLFYKLPCKWETSFSFTSGLGGQKSQVPGSHHDKVSRLKKSLPSLNSASRVTLTGNITDSKTEKAWQSHRGSYEHLFESTRILCGRPIVWSYLGDGVLRERICSPGSSFPALHCRRKRESLWKVHHVCHRDAVIDRMLLNMLPSSYNKEVCGPCRIILLHQASKSSLCHLSSIKGQWDLLIAHVENHMLLLSCMALYLLCIST